MESTFSFIDKLIVLLKVVPRSLDLKKDETNAKNTVVLLEEYTTILRNHLENHATEEYLEKLHKSNSKKIKKWVEHIAATFEKIDALLIVLDRDIEVLKLILRRTGGLRKNKAWLDAIGEFSMGMVGTGLHTDEMDLMFAEDSLKESIGEEVKVLAACRSTSVFDEGKLKELRGKHLDARNDWGAIASLTGDVETAAQKKFFGLS